MTQTVDFDIVGSYNNQRIHSIDSERSVNLFEYRDPLGKKPKSLIYTSGLIDTDVIFESSTGGFRGQFFFLGDMYVVIGSDIYRVSSSFVLSKLNSTPLATSTGYIGIDANTHQVIFVDGSKGYLWDTQTSIFTYDIKTNADSNFPSSPLDVCYLDGFFIVAAGNTNTFQLSALYQGLVWGTSSDTFTGSAATDLLTLSSTANYPTGVPITFSTTGALPTPLNSSDTYYSIRIDATTLKVATTYADAIIGTAIDLMSDGTATNTITKVGQIQVGQINSHPGTIVACRTLHRQLFLFSQFYTEVWENAGIGTNLPFRRNNSLLMEYGTPAIGSIAVGFDKMFFLSQDRDGLGAVMEVSGAQAIRVSNRALDVQLGMYAANPLTGVADCRSFLIKENGLIFYRMNFTLANHTFVYDVTLSNPLQEDTKLWHEEEVLDGSRHPAQTHAYFNGLNYVGDYANPVMYVVSPAIYTNNGELIRRMRITRPLVPPGYQRIRVDRLQIDLLQGNVSNLQPIIEDIDLFTEDLFTIETEDGDPIILQDGLVIYNPQDLWVLLSLSKDGGQTYGYTQRAPMGNIGQRTFRTLWRKLGTTKRGQAFVAKLEFFDAVPFVILGASWATEVLPE